MADRPEYEMLSLKNQLCFPLYACSREIIKRYHPFLVKLDLTYTQYITMMVLWERKQMNVKEIGECLYLDSGTLTPLLKKLEQKGFIRRHRSKEDERNLLISITPEGEALRDEAVNVPAEMKACMSLDPQDAADLYRLLYKFLDKCQERRNQDK